MNKAGNRTSIIHILKRSVNISLSILFIMSCYAFIVVNTLRYYQNLYLNEIYKYRNLSESLLYLSEINDHLYSFSLDVDEFNTEHIINEKTKFISAFNKYLNKNSELSDKETMKEMVDDVSKELENILLYPKIDQLSDAKDKYNIEFYNKYVQLKEVINIELEYIDGQQKLFKIRHDKIESKGLLIFLIVMLSLCLLIIKNRRVLIKGVSEPLNKLNFAINRIINGDYGVRIEENIKNELGDLCNTINTMSIEIQKSRHSLLKAKEETERYHQQLAESHKMASIGVMSSGIAHELSQPLGVILLKSELVLMLLDKGKYDKIKKEYKDIEKQVLRAKKIIDSLRIISREAKEEEKSIIDLNKIVQDVIPLFKDEFRISGINVVTLLSEVNTYIYASQVQICQILTNLISNARDAVREVNEPEIVIRTNKDNREVTVSISDNGTGIHEKSIKRVFEPFYTLKKVGKGTGLGLSLCQSMVKENEGKIYVDSEVGVGTTFYISFSINKEPLHE